MEEKIKLKILFIQQFPLTAQGGGAVILDRLIRHKPEACEIVCAYEKNTFEYNGKSLHNHIGLKSIKRNFRYGIGRLICIGVFQFGDFLFTKHLRKVISDERPDVIHLTSHGLLFKDAIKIVSKINIPFFVSIHDDWHSTISSCISNKKAKNILRKYLIKSASNFVISEEMGEYLKSNLIIKDYEVIHDGITSADKTVKKYSSIISDELNILYVGMLFETQLKTINTFIDAIENINLVEKINVHVCSNSSLEVIKPHRKVSIINHGWVSEDYIMNLGKIMHGGILPISFSSKDALFYKTSFMTKIPFYVRLHLPIICISPSYSSSYKVIQKDGIGILIDKLDSSLIQEQISRFINLILDNPNIFESRILESIDNRFNFEKICSSFYQSIIRSYKFSIK